MKDAGALDVAKNLKKRVSERVKAVPYVGSALSAAVDNVRVLSDAIDELKESFNNNESQLNALILMVEGYVKDNELGLTKEAIMDFNQDAVNVVHRMIAEYSADEEEGAEVVPVDDVDELAKDLANGAPKAAKPKGKRVVRKVKKPKAAAA